jgi:hypothetical protein
MDINAGQGTFFFSKQPFACHSEGGTHSNLMVQKKLFSNMLIIIPATEESYACLSTHGMA